MESEEDAATEAIAASALPMQNMWKTVWVSPQTPGLVTSYSATVSATPPASSAAALSATPPADSLQPTGSPRESEEDAAMEADVVQQQLYLSIKPNDIHDLVFSLEKCILEVRDWMSINKLKLNDEKNRDNSYQPTKSMMQMFQV